MTNLENRYSHETVVQHNCWIFKAEYHICVTKLVRRCLRSWLAVFLAWGRYLKQCRLILFGHMIARQHFNQIKAYFLHENAFQNVVCKMIIIFALEREHTSKIPMNTWRNNNVVITSKRRHFDVITSKWHRVDVITTSLLRNVSAGMHQAL